MKKKSTQLLFFILMLVVISQASIDLYLPSLPTMVHVLLSTNTQIQLSLTLFLVGYSFSQLFYGPLSDRYGRKPSVVAGVAIYTVGSLICTFTTTVEILLLGRLIQGIGIGAGSTLSRAIVRDIYSGKDLTKIMSYLAVIWSMVPICAPLLGGYIQAYLGWRYNFVLMSLTGFIMLLVLYFKLPETKKVEERQSLHIYTIFKNYFTLLSSRIFLGYVLSVFVLYGIFIAWNTAGPFLLQNRIGLTPVEYGWTLLLIAFGYMTGSFINGKLTHSYDLHELILIGVIGLFFTSLIFLICALQGMMNFYVFTIPVLFIELFIGFIYPNCISGSMHQFPEISGSASALFGFIAILGGCFSSMVLAKLPETSQLPLATTIFIQTLLTIAIVATFLFYRKK